MILELEEISDLELVRAPIETYKQFKRILSFVVFKLFNYIRIWRKQM